MRKIYFAGPLFSLSEREFNWNLTLALRNLGHQVFLPQESNSNKKKRTYEEFDAQAIFDCDMQGLEWSDCMLVLLEGTTPDPGACFEMGYAYANGKPIYGLRTDIRGTSDLLVNLMLTRSCQHIYTDIKCLLDFFKVLGHGSGQRECIVQETRLRRAPPLFIISEENGKTRA